MKHTNIFLATIFLFFSITINGQNCIGTNTTNEFPCCNQQINIDPLDNTYIVNTERLGLLNNKDINFQNFDVKYLDQNFSMKAINAFNVETYLNNPIFSTFAEYDMMTNWRQYYDVEKLPMHPKNGWQLMHHYDGWKPFTRFNNPINMTSINSGLVGYHHLYYNKYTGKARVIIYPQSDVPYNASELSLNLRLVKNIIPKPDASAIFNIYNDRLLGLDKKTVADEVKSYLASNQNVGSINGSYLDFDLYYDPCVCVTKPILEFEARQRTTLSLYAEGKYAGITQQFDNSGQLPSNYGTEWLGSVYGDYKGGNDFEVSNGFQIYKTANEIKTKFYVSDKMKLLAEGIKLLGNATSTITIPIGLNVGDLIGRIPFLSNSLLNKSVDIPIGNLLSGGANYLAGQLNPSVPNVSFSEGQIAMRGKIIGDQKWAGFNTRSIVHPGSRSSYNAALGQYPYYNENVGLFAIINTPKVWFNHSQFYDNNLQKHRLLTEISLVSPLKYVFNSAADIDMIKSKVFAVIEFDIYMHYIDTVESAKHSNGYLYNIEESMNNFFSPRKGFAVVNRTRLSLDSLNYNLAKIGQNISPLTSWNYNTNQWVYFSSKYIHKYTIQTLAKIPIDKISNYQFNFEFDNGLFADKFLFANFSNTFFGGPSFTGSSFNANMNNTKFRVLFDPRIKVISEYEYLPNRFETPNKFLQVLTYNTEYTFDKPSKPLVTNYIFPDVIYTSSYGFTPTNNSITANTIIVDNVINYPFPITLNGINSVDIVAGGQISPTTTIQIIKDPLGHVSLNPVSETEIKNFCNNGNYQSKSFAKAAILKPNLETKLNNDLAIVIFPNPTSSKTTLTLSGYENTSVSVMIFDLVGREVYTQLEKDITAREHQAVLNTESLQAGTYIVKVFNGTEEKIAKLVILKN